MFIQELHYDIKSTYNKLDSNNRVDLVPAQIDRIINNSSLELVELVYGGNVSKLQQYGFEATQQLTDLLSNFVIKNPDQPTLSPASYNSDFQVYEFRLSDLEYRYLHLLRMYVTTNCGKIRIGKVYQNEHDDLNVILLDAMTRPSKKWKRLVAVLGRSSANDGTSSIYVYTNGEFTISGLDVEYLKYPDKVFFGGYDTLEYLSGDLTAPTSSDPPINSEFPDWVQRTLLINMCVGNISANLYDYNQSQLRDNKINNLI